jgi:hypothetical protein
MGKLLMAIMISILAFTTLAWAASGFTCDFMRVAQPKQPACTPPPAEQLISRAASEAHPA